MMPSAISFQLRVHRHLVRVRSVRAGDRRGQTVCVHHPRVAIGSGDREQLKCSLPAMQCCSVTLLPAAMCINIEGSLQSTIAAAARGGSGRVLNCRTPQNCCRRPRQKPPPPASSSSRPPPARSFPPPLRSSRARLLPRLAHCMRTVEASGAGPSCSCSPHADGCPAPAPPCLVVPLRPPSACWQLHRGPVHTSSPMITLLSPQRERRREKERDTHTEALLPSPPLALFPPSLSPSFFFFFRRDRC